MNLIQRIDTALLILDRNAEEVPRNAVALDRLEKSVGSEHRTPGDTDPPRL